MYQYNDTDKQIVRERVAQFRGQTERFLAGELPEEQFLPLRLQNGLYVQRLAPMLRVAVPYGLMNSAQLRKLAHIARHYDKGYCHLTTRQNVQFNWPELADVPDILAELADVEMHAIQTSGNCIRNVTSDQFAGIAKDEIVDPRPYCEIIRQWSTFHPEFAFLPRKFKIAVSGTEGDRAAIHFHDIGLQIVMRNDQIGFKVLVGGGLGRTPVIGSVINEFVSEQNILAYLEAILRVYNQRGRRDNKYKARIKILVKALGASAFAELVEAEFASSIKHNPDLLLTKNEIERVKKFFTAPAYKPSLRSITDDELRQRELQTNKNELSAKRLSNWLTHNTTAHRMPGYRAVTLSVKETGIAPGDLTDAQLEAVADLADDFSFGEVRVTHMQNLVLADVEESRLAELHAALLPLGFATANIGTLTDIICCPGGDFCSLANAKSIPVAEAIQREFDDLDYLYDLGDLELNISGCMNACGHHHIGHIGVLGVDKKGQEFYQIQLGGSQGNDASLAKVLGPSFSRDEVTGIIKRLINTYVDNRIEGESFLATYRRVGHELFKENAYAKAS